MNGEFKVTDTPRNLDTYAGDVEEITATWQDGATWEDGKLVLRADTVSAEGYSVPVRLAVDATLVRGLLRDIAAATAIVEPPRGTLVTKWDLIDRVERALLDATPTRAHDGGHIVCSGCGTELPTEGAFARHYIVPDRRFKGLGYCPARGKRTDGTG
jgi:hypothetical protein